MENGAYPDNWRSGLHRSHTSVELLNAGHEIVVVDNLVNSKYEAITRIQELGGRSFPFHQVDLLDRDALSAVFDQYTIDAVIHFAALKAVGESVRSRSAITTTTLQERRICVK